MADPDNMINSVDVTNCDREPIHIPGAILPHGAMLVLDADTLEVLQAAGDTSRLLGVPLEELLGQSVIALFRPDQIENLRGLAAALDLVKPRHLLDPQMRVIINQPLDASLHRSAGLLVLEFEAADPSDRFAADPLAGVQEMVRGSTSRPLSKHCASWPPNGCATSPATTASLSTASCTMAPVGSSQRAESRISNPS